MKGFGDIYQNIVEKSGEELKNLKSENLARDVILIAIIIGCIAIAFLLDSIIVGIVGVIVCIVIAAIFGKKFEEYRSKYKSLVIERFIKEYSEKLDYYPKKGISSSEYRESGFETFYDRFYSEDLITGTILENKKITMAEVHTEIEDTTTDSDGNTTTTYVTSFHGLFACIDLESLINLEFKIEKNALLSDVFKGKKKLDMDSGEFEKVFDVNTNDKISTLRILTADVMQMLLDFKRDTKIVPEMIFRNNRLYIRFALGNVFEPNSFKSDIDFDNLKKIYDLINFVFKLTEDFAKNIENFEE